MANFGNLAARTGGQRASPLRPAMNPNPYWLAFLALGFAAPARAQAPLPYRAGVGVETITPCSGRLRETNRCRPDYIHVDAYDLKTSGGNAREVSSVESDLQARALVLEDAQGKRVALVTVDVLNLAEGFTPGVRARVAALGLGLAGPDVVLNAAHTHNGPAGLDLSRNGPGSGVAPESPPNPQYLLGLQDKIVAAVQQAVRNLQPASLAVGVTQSDVATYRRRDGTQASGARVPQRLDVFQARGADGQLLAVAYFFGCHATTMYANAGQVSADFPGASRTYVEEALRAGSPNVKALFFQGFGGDLEADGFTSWRDGLAVKNRTGQAVGAAVVGAVNGPVTALTGPFALTSRTVGLSLDPGATAWPSNGARALPTEIQEWQIGGRAGAAGPWTVLFCAHEVVSEYAANARSAYADPAAVTLAGYSNFVGSYLPTQRMQAADALDCGLPPRGYEGCYAFQFFGLCRPAWTDDEFFAHQTLFADDFDANARDPDQWVATTYAQAGGQPQYDAGVGVAARQQQLEITPLAGRSGLHYNAFASVHTYNVANQQVSVELVQAPNAASHAEFNLCLVRNAANRYAFTVQAGQLRADQWVAGVSAAVPLGAYDPAQHRYLRMRSDAAANALLWEVSADGRGWRALHAQAPAMSLAAMRVELLGGTYQAETAPGTIILDNFRAPGPAPSIPTPTVPFPAVFADDFDGNVRDAEKWTAGTDIRAGGRPLNDASVAVAAQNQQLVIAPLVATDGLHYNGWRSARAYNFAGQQAAVQVVQAPNPASHAEFALYVEKDSANYYAFTLQAGQLRADQRIAGQVTSFSLGGYDPAQHQYLRIRSDPGAAAVAWETSADGRAWRPARTQAPEMALDAVRLGLLGGSYQPESAPGAIVLDNFNVPGAPGAQRVLGAPPGPGGAAAEAPVVQQNYPNPVRTATTIAYFLPRPDHVSLRVYDATGRPVATLLDEAQPGGAHAVRYDTRALRSGLYFYRLSTPRFSGRSWRLRVE